MKDIGRQMFPVLSFKFGKSQIDCVVVLVLTTVQQSPAVYLLENFVILL